MPAPPSPMLQFKLPALPNLAWLGRKEEQRQAA
jgi:hypothetical protein